MANGNGSYVPSPPLIPAKVVPWAAALYMAAVAAEATLPPHTIGWSVAHFGALLLAGVLGVSAGIRRNGNGNGNGK